MQELLWLLLPVAAASGWVLARRAGRPVLPASRGSRMPQAYLQGLNYLLNEQPDKAIEVLVRILEVDSETVETHLALGSLFRRRGEVDRAIRIHQNLIARPTLEPAQRAQALRELGQDYMRAGLFDRAEGIFRDLVRFPEHADSARTQLLDIYQQEKEWENAIAAVRELGSLPGDQRRVLAAQFYCELAEEALRAGDRRRVRHKLRKAVAVDRSCARASLLEGEMEAAEGNYKAAIRAYRRVEQQDSAFLPEILDPLQACYRQLDDPDGYQRFLQGAYEAYQGTSVVLALASEIHQREGREEATRFIVEELRKKPSVRGLDWLLGMHLDEADGRPRDELHILRQITSSLLAQRSAYKCVHCGFAAKSLHWQCPGCRNWSTIRPVQGVEGE